MLEQLLFHPLYACSGIGNRDIREVNVEPLPAGEGLHQGLGKAHELCTAEPSVGHVFPERFVHGQLVQGEVVTVYHCPAPIPQVPVFSFISLPALPKQHMRKQAVAHHAQERQHCASLVPLGGLALLDFVYRNLGKKEVEFLRSQQDIVRALICTRIEGAQASEQAVGEPHGMDKGQGTVQEFHRPSYAVHFVPLVVHAFKGNGIEVLGYAVAKARELVLPQVQLAGAQGVQLPQPVLPGVVFGEVRADGLEFGKGMGIGRKA